MIMSWTERYSNEKTAAGIVPTIIHDLGAVRPVVNWVGNQVTHLFTDPVTVAKDWIHNAEIPFDQGKALQSGHYYTYRGPGVTDPSGSELAHGAAGAALMGTSVVKGVGAVGRGVGNGIQNLKQKLTDADVGGKVWDAVSDAGTGVSNAIERAKQTLKRGE